MNRLLLVAGVFSVVSCAEVECGAGTRLEGRSCVAAVDGGAGGSSGGTATSGGAGGGTATAGGSGGGTSSDAGVAVLPTTALIDPITVVEGFAACPSVQLGFPDGTNARVILDPGYRVPVGRTLRIAESGLTLSFESTDGSAEGVVVPSCAAAVAGKRAGVGTVRLRVSNAGGQSAELGSAAITVLALPATGSLAINTVVPTTFPTASEYGGLAVGEVRALQVTPVIQVPSMPAQIGVIPTAVTITSSDPSRLVVEGDRTIRGVAPGDVTLTATWSGGGRTFTSAPFPLKVIDPVATPLQIVFDLPTGDDGLYFPESVRNLDRLSVGQCFRAAPFALHGSTGVAVLARRADLSVQLVGSALASAGAGRYCAMTAGDAALRACAGGRCDVLGVVVKDSTSPPVLSATVTPAMLHTGRPGPQTICLDLSVKAAWAGAAEVDVSTSPALRFAAPFRISPFDALTVQLDPSTGLPQRMQGKPCFSVDVTGAPTKGFRVFYGGGAVEVPVTIEP